MLPEIGVGPLISQSDTWRDIQSGAAAPGRAKRS